MKTAKVTQVHDTKEWSGKNGIVIYCNLTLDNGDEINIGKKKAPSVGDELNYELTGGDDGQQKFKKAKSVNPENQNHVGGGGSNQNSYGRDQDSILYQTCLKAISENYVSRSGGTIIELKIEEVDRIATLALHLAQLSKKNIETLKAN